MRRRNLKYCLSTCISQENEISHNNTKSSKTTYIPNKELMRFNITTKEERRKSQLSNFETNFVCGCMHVFQIMMIFIHFIENQMK